MRIIYSAIISGAMDIPEEDLAGKTKREREIYINTLVSEQAEEDAGDTVEWEEVE